MSEKTIIEQLEQQNVEKKNVTFSLEKKLDEKLTNICKKNNWKKNQILNMLIRDFTESSVA
ncbi:MAG: hypothetical protein U9Q83_02815 [Bacteroidota bacterium]|nr:hypothetical protein [Bacteroidota bacterium]